MARVYFKPTKDQQDAATIAATGREGVLVGYCTQPGGAWSGDYKVADLRDFEHGAGRDNARIWITKTILFPKGPPTFPIAEARAAAQKERLAEKFRQGYEEHIDPGTESEDTESEDEETATFFQRQAKEREEEMTEQTRTNAEDERIICAGKTLHYPRLYPLTS